MAEHSCPHNCCEVYAHDLNADMLLTQAHPDIHWATRNKMLVANLLKAC